GSGAPAVDADWKHPARRGALVIAVAAVAHVGIEADAFVTAAREPGPARLAPRATFALAARAVAAWRLTAVRAHSSSDSRSARRPGAASRNRACRATPTRVGP